MGHVRVSSANTRMAIKFVLMVNKQGQTRLAQYFCGAQTVQEKEALESEVIRKCLARAEHELAILEFIHTMVETLDKYFENVCELDIMFNIEKAHFILDEMLMNGHIVETNKANILTPIKLMDKLGS